MNLIYDLSCIGLCYKKPKFQTGVYRLADSLLKSIIKNNINEIDLQFSHCQYINNRKFSEQYLNENNIDFPIITPFNLEGYLFPITYRRFPIIRKTLNALGFYGNGYLDKEKIPSSKTIFYSPLYPIPNDIANYKQIKSCITIHDIIYIKFPTDNYLKELTENIIQSSMHSNIFCVSKYTKNDLCNYAPNINPEKIKVIPSAPPPNLFYPCKNHPNFVNIKKKYNLPNNYFLSLSSFEERKNLPHLIQSFIQFIEQEKINDISLVLVGSLTNFKHTVLDSIPSYLKDRIIVTGRIADEDLAPIYSNAICFFFMSLYEGFGLPPLEAMQCGTPVVTSNTTSLPEVVNDAGIMLDPTDKDALSQTMKKVYFDSNLLIKMSGQSIENGKRFNWDNIAKEYMHCFKEIIN